MAFNNKNFGCLYGNAGGSVRLFVYNNVDGDTLTTAGYFPSSLGLETGDRILIVPASTAPSWMKITVSNGVATAAALS